MNKSKQSLGWREWAALPQLNIPALRVKLDTGARTSALHTFSLETFEVDRQLKVRFAVHPIRKRPDIEIFCVANVIGQRRIKSSNGHYEERLVIRTPIRIGHREWPIDITLTNRAKMKFPMLLGRIAMQGHIIVDPEAAYTTGRTLRNAYRNWK